MYLKTRIERLEQTDNGKARVLVNIPIGSETWERRKFVLHSALYRAYLEQCLVSAPKEALDALADYLPRAVAIHREADPVHAEQTLAYLARFFENQSATLHFENMVDKISFIEHCLSAEMRHVGLPQ
jgi:hypothetical protein